GRLMRLHAPGDADALLRGEPEPGPFLVAARLELGDQRLGRGDPSLQQRLPLLGARPLRGLDRPHLLLRGGAGAEDLGPELVDLGEVPPQVACRPPRAGGYLLVAVGGGQGGGEAVRLLTDGDDRVVAHTPSEARRRDIRHPILRGTTCTRYPSGV